MALVIITGKPSELLKAIQEAIDGKKISTWSYDADGDFTHTPDQWSKKAWFRPKIYLGELHFGLLGPKGTKLSKVTYGVYHGRFIEMLLTHFDKEFKTARATALKGELDNFT